MHSWHVTSAAAAAAAEQASGPAPPQLPAEAATPTEVARAAGPPTPSRAEATARALPLPPAEAPVPAALPEAAHERELLAAFHGQQALRWTATDMCASLFLTALLLNTMLTINGWSRGQWAAVGAEVAVLLTPYLLALLAPAWYLLHRTSVVASCRLASVFLLGQAVPPRLLPAAANSRGAFWLHYLAASRVLGLIMFAFANRLPLKWLAWVNLVGTLEAARLALGTICQAPVFCGTAAREHLQALADVPASLRFFAPLSFPTLTAPSHSVLQCHCGSGTMLCLCQQVTLWVLACFGYALPLLCQYIEHVAALRSFARRHCRWWPHCHSCAQTFAPDMVSLVATCSLLFLGFCATSWQLITAWAASGRGAEHGP